VYLYVKTMLRIIIIILLCVVFTNQNMCEHYLKMSGSEDIQICDSYEIYRIYEMINDITKYQRERNNNLLEYKLQCDEYNILLVSI